MDGSAQTIGNTRTGEVESAYAWLRLTGCVFGAVQQNISYLRELVAGDIVEVRSRVLEIRDKLIRFQHEMVNSTTGEVCARCEQTTVHIDAKARRAQPFPDAIRAAAEKAICESGGG